MSIPLFFSPTNYVRALPYNSEECDASLSLFSLCVALDIPCRASGYWITRKVSIKFTDVEDITIYATPGSMGDVLVAFPEKYRDFKIKNVLQLTLGVMAFAIHDLVAKESIRGYPWAGIEIKKGRPKSIRPMSNKERQSAYRSRQAA